MIIRFTVPALHIDEVRALYRELATPDDQTSDVDYESRIRSLSKDNVGFHYHIEPILPFLRRDPGHYYLVSYTLEDNSWWLLGGDNLSKFTVPLVNVELVNEFNTEPFMWNMGVR